MNGVAVVGRCNSPYLSLGKDVRVTGSSTIFIFRHNSFHRPWLYIPQTRLCSSPKRLLCHEHIVAAIIWGLLCAKVPHQLLSCARSCSPWEGVLGVGALSLVPPEQEQDLVF